MHEHDAQTMVSHFVHYVIAQHFRINSDLSLKMPFANLMRTRNSLICVWNIWFFNFFMSNVSTSHLRILNNISFNYKLRIQLLTGYFFYLLFFSPTCLLILSRPRWNWRLPAKVKWFPPVHRCRRLVTGGHRWPRLLVPSCTPGPPSYAQAELCGGGWLGLAV